MTTTTSLEQSKRLKELGAPQDTDFKWCDGTSYDPIQLVKYPPLKNSEIIAAYTLSELLEWVKTFIKEPEFIRMDIGVMTKLQVVLPTKIGESIMETHRIQVDSPTPLDACYKLCIAIKEGKV